MRAAARQSRATYGRQKYNTRQRRAPTRDRRRRGARDASSRIGRARTEAAAPVRSAAAAMNGPPRANVTAARSRSDSRPRGGKACSGPCRIEALTDPALEAVSARTGFASRRAVPEKYSCTDSLTLRATLNSAPPAATAAGAQTLLVPVRTHRLPPHEYEGHVPFGADVPRAVALRKADDA